MPARKTAVEMVWQASGCKACQVNLENVKSGIIQTRSVLQERAYTS